MNIWAKVTSDDQHGEYKKGDYGLVAGFVRAADEKPYAVIALQNDRRLVMIPLYLLEIERLT